LSLSRRAAHAVFASVAFAGLWLGYRHAHWQDCVEPAQVLAGVVTYKDTGNPFFIYQTKVATVLHPLCAAGLRLGLDERQVSVLISMLMAAVFFLAIASWTWAIARSVSLALAMPPILAIVDTTNWGLRYPLNLLVASTTYGALGLGVALLAGGLVVCGRRFWGGFLAALTPAVHVVLGAWTLVVLAITVLLERREPDRRAPLRDPLLQGAFAGLALSATFFAAHFLTAPARPSIDPQVAAQHLTRFVGTAWHQGPIDFDWPPVHFVLAVLVLVLAAAGRRGFDTPVSEGARLALRFVAVAGAFGLAIAGAHTLLGDRSPQLLIVAMPCRLLNLAVITGFLCLVSLAWTAPAAIGRAAVVAFMGVSVYLRYREVANAEIWILRAATVSCLALVLATGWWARSREASKMLAWAALPLGLLIANGFAHGRASLWAVGLATALGLAVRTRIDRERPAGPASPSHVAWAQKVVASALLSIGAWCATRAADVPALDLRDRTNEPVLARTARGRGLLLVGCEMDPIQMLVRRPLLLDPEQIDMLPYAIEGAPAAQRIDEQIYGGWMLGSPPVSCRETWQRRTPQEWADIARRFAVTEAITLGDWTLQLPVSARDEQYALYALPGAAVVSDAPASDR
jgi:hypothetical protein